MNRGKNEHERKGDHVLLIERELGSANRAKGNLHINNLSSTAGRLASNTECLL